MMATTEIVSKRVRRVLGLSLHGWENAMVVFLIIAGFFALLAGAATWAVVRMQRIEIAKSQQEFERYKVDAKADADVKIDAARTEAKSALEKSNTESNERIRVVEETAKVEVAKASQSAEQAKADAADANKKAESERLERLKLEAILGPRTLTLAQQQLLALSWKPLAGKRVAVISYSLDGEGATLATQIIAALEVAGVNVDNRLASVMPMGGFSLGVHVTGSDTDAANILRATLANVGGLAVAAPGSPQGGGPSMSSVPAGGPAQVAAEILVGIKPVQTIR